MKIKITQPGYEGFTGYFGSVHFTDGVSDDDVGRAEAQRLAALVRVEDMDGHDPSPAQQILDNWTRPMEVASTPEAAVEAPKTGVTYTDADLAAVADAKGIKGLRAIADPLGIKGNSIAELIGKILAVAGAPAPAAEVTEAAEPEVKEEAQAAADAGAEQAS